MILIVLLRELGEMMSDACLPCLELKRIYYDFLCSAYASSMSALKQPTIRVVAIIAEGVPEGDAKQLIAYARANNKV
jgi:hypothetical protein